MANIPTYEDMFSEATKRLRDAGLVAAREYVLSLAELDDRDEIFGNSGETPGETRGQTGRSPLICELERDAGRRYF